jgi:hypothetical protein
MSSPDDGLDDLGRFGSERFDLRVFEQSTLWIDRSGRRHLVATLSATEVDAVIGYLEKHEVHFYVQCLHRDVLATQLRALAEQGSAGPAAVGSDEAALLLADMAPATWMARTELMRALRARRAALSISEDGTELAGGLSLSLRDDDVGVWAVVTTRSLYVLDLNARNVLRSAGPDAEQRRSDQRWQPLVRLRRCDIGDVFTVVVRGGDGLSRPFQSASPVASFALSGLHA